MLTGRLRIEVRDEHGTAALIVDAPQLDLVKQMIVADLADGAVAALTGLPGINGADHARHVLLAALVRQHADEAAYERVAQQKGLLPL
jgi:hypothetical protein